MQAKLYEINGYTIAAKNADQAFGLYMEETNSMDSCYVDEMEEGETEEIVITVRRLTSMQITDQGIYCCDNGSCTFCKDSDEGVLISYQDWIDKHVKDESSLPVVVAHEE